MNSILRKFFLCVKTRFALCVECMKQSLQNRAKKKQSVYNESIFSVSEFMIRAARFLYGLILAASSFGIFGIIGAVDRKEEFPGWLSLLVFLTCTIIGSSFLFAKIENDYFAERSEGGTNG